ncbi:MAG: hypothetical protein ACMUEL_06575 [Flavobacteriales bacterium Tduv]
MFRLFGVENKKFRSMLRNIAQISFSELYMERDHCLNGGLHLYRLLDGLR